MNKIVEAYQKGQTIRQIANELGFGKTTIWLALKESGLKMRPKGDRRLFDVEKAIQYRDKGYSYRRIARILGVSHSGIYRKIARATHQRNYSKTS